MISSWIGLLAFQSEPSKYATNLCLSKQKPQEVPKTTFLQPRKSTEHREVRALCSAVVSWVHPERTGRPHESSQIYKTWSVWTELSFLVAVVGCEICHLDFNFAVAAALLARFKARDEKQIASMHESIKQVLQDQSFGKFRSPRRELSNATNTSHIPTSWCTSYRRYLVHHILIQKCFTWFLHFLDLL